MIRVNGAYINYGESKIINNISFDIGNSDKLIILGRNGVGKTTLLKGLIGLLPIHNGKLYLDDKDITKLKAYEKSQLGLAYVPQGREIIPNITVLENLRLGGIAHKEINIENKIKEVLEYFPVLKQHLQRMGGVLSGGQQQQLAIARALMSEPKLIMLDEPTEGIQPNIVMEIAEFLSWYHEEKKIPILVVEQNLHFAQRLGSRYLIIQKGTIVDQGEIQELTQEKSEKYLSI